MKKIKKTFLYLLGFAFALLAFTVIINLSIFDEELLPEVQAIKDIKAKPYGADNAYPALIAINSESGSSLQAATKTVRKALNRQIAESGIDYLSEKQQKELAGGDDSSWKKSYQQCRSRTEKNCMSPLIDQLRASPIKDTRLIAQIERYKDLIEFTDFKEATQMKFDSPLIGFSSTMALKRFYLADSFINGSIDDFLTAWQKDMKFWRMVLSKSHLLLTRMVSAATVRTSIDSLSTVIRQGSLSQQQLNQLKKTINKLSQQETDLSTTFESEFKGFLSIYDDPELLINFGNTFTNMFFQPQATKNTQFKKITKVLLNVSKKNAAAFYDYITSQQYKADTSSPFSWSPTTLYNPTGKILIGLAVPAYTDYIARMHDLNGMIHLLKLQIEIALNPAKDIEQVIVQSQYTNPYTLKPMSYNKDSHSIYFECMDKHSVCELNL